MTSSKKIFFPMIAIALFAAGCAGVSAQAQQAEPQAPVTIQVLPAKADPLVRFPQKTLSPDLAANLVLNESAQFASAVTLAATRPKAVREISEIKFGLVSVEKPEMRLTRLNFTPLPSGLNFTSQRFLDSEREDKSIDVYGAVPAATLYDFVLFGKRMDIAGASQVRLLSGRLFDGNSPYVLSTMQEGSGYIVDCRPTKRVEASTLHPLLTGFAVRYECKLLVSDSDERGASYYLEDAALYVPAENGIGSDSPTTFNIMDISYR